MPHIDYGSKEATAPITHGHHRMGGPSGPLTPTEGRNHQTQVKLEPGGAANNPGGRKRHHTTHVAASRGGSRAKRPPAKTSKRAMTRAKSRNGTCAERPQALDELGNTEMCGPANFLRKCKKTYQLCNEGAHAHLNKDRKGPEYVDCSAKLCTKEPHFHYGDEETLDLLETFGVSPSLSTSCSSSSETSTISTLSTSSSSSTSTESGDSPNTKALPSTPLVDVGVKDAATTTPPEEKYGTGKESETDCASTTPPPLAQNAIDHHEYHIPLASKAPKTRIEEFRTAAVEYYDKTPWWALAGGALTAAGTIVTCVVAGPVAAALVTAKLAAGNAGLLAGGFACKTVKAACEEQEPGELPEIITPGPYTKEVIEKVDVFDPATGKKTGTEDVVHEVNIPMQRRVIFHDFGHYDRPLAERIIDAVTPSCCQEPVFMVNEEQDLLMSEVQACAMPVKRNFNISRLFTHSQGDYVSNNVGAQQIRHTMKGRYTRCHRGLVFTEVFDGLMRDKQLTALQILDQHGKVKTHINSAISRTASNLFPAEQSKNRRVFLETIQHVENQLVLRCVTYGTKSAAPLD